MDEGKKQALLDFLMLRISYTELRVKLGKEMHNNGSAFAIVAVEDLVRTVRNADSNSIDKDALSHWVDFVWFSDYYEYNELDNEFIATVMNELEDPELLDESSYREMLLRVGRLLDSHLHGK